MRLFVICPSRIAAFMILVNICVQMNKNKTKVNTTNKTKNEPREIKQLSYSKGQKPVKHDTMCLGSK